MTEIPTAFNERFLSSKFKLTLLLQMLLTRPIIVNWFWLYDVIIFVMMHAKWIKVIIIINYGPKIKQKREAAILYINKRFFFQSRIKTPKLSLLCKLGHLNCFSIDHTEWRVRGVVSCLQLKIANKHKFYDFFNNSAFENFPFRRSSCCWRSQKTIQTISRIQDWDGGGMKNGLCLKVTPYP